MSVIMIFQCEKLTLIEFEFNSWLLIVSAKLKRKYFGGSKDYILAGCHIELVSDLIYATYYMHYIFHYIMYRQWRIRFRYLQVMKFSHSEILSLNLLPFSIKANNNNNSYMNTRISVLHPHICHCQILTLSEIFFQYEIYQFPHILPCLTRSYVLLIM